MCLTTTIVMGCSTPDDGETGDDDGNTGGNSGMIFFTIYGSAKSVMSF